jgi:hypothetical protein
VQNEQFRATVKEAVLVLRLRLHFPKEIVLLIISQLPAHGVFLHVDPDSFSFQKRRTVNPAEQRDAVPNADLEPVRTWSVRIDGLRVVSTVGWKLLREDGELVS